jgi:hypothetical protein
LLKDFKKRWFVYDDATNRLTYFKDRTSTTAQGFIDMGAVVAVVMLMPQTDLRFNVMTATRTYALKSPSAAEASRWVDALNAILARKPSIASSSQPASPPDAPLKNSNSSISSPQLERREHPTTSSTSRAASPQIARREPALKSSASSASETPLKNSNSSIPSPQLERRDRGQKTSTSNPLAEQRDTPLKMSTSSISSSQKESALAEEPNRTEGDHAALTEMKEQLVQLQQELIDARNTILRSEALLQQQSDGYERLKTEAIGLETKIRQMGNVQQQLDNMVVANERNRAEGAQHIGNLQYQLSEARKTIRALEQQVGNKDGDSGMSKWEYQLKAKVLFHIYGNKN